MKNYSSLVTALVFAALTVLSSALGDNHVSVVEGMQIAVAVATAFGVWASGYLPAGVVWPKPVVAGALAALNLLISYLGQPGHHLTGAEWVNVALAVLAAVGVGAVPAAQAAVRRRQAAR